MTSKTFYNAEKTVPQHNQSNIIASDQTMTNYNSVEINRIT